MKSRKVKIHKVLPGSIAEEAGIKPGDSILSVNREHIKDIFDYRFLIADEFLVIEVEKEDGEVWEVEIEKDQYEDIGIEFENPMIEDAKSCTNKCIFCFIDQLPKGMRETLYFKDDDSRLSFLAGNYVTLTNMGHDDIDRIIRYRMSPINVSVHTTNPQLRVSMLGNRFAGDIRQKIQRLVEGGITVNCQIVLCRGINDGEELDRTIQDLTDLSPGVASISVVPVGITRHREGLFELKPYDKDASHKVISQVESWQEKLLERHGSRIVYIADEFYIMAEYEIPPYEHYEDFPQLENGVGLVALLRYEFKEYLEQDPPAPSEPRKVSIATGVSSEKYIREMTEELEKRYNNLKVYVYEIKNIFFGKNVTVTGLLTGRDLISQLKGKKLGDVLLISESMLKSGEKIFLDDVTVHDVERELNIKVESVQNSGKDFVDKVLGIGE